MRRLCKQRVAVRLALAAVCAGFCVSAPAAAAEPVTAAADSLRTSWYPEEPQLTPQLVESDFGPNFSVPVQGQVYAQPLVSGHTLFVATEKNWIYAIDSVSGGVEWEKNVGTPFDPAELPCGDLAPDVGITGTPVIEPSTDVAYFLAKSYVSGTSGPAVWKMHAVSLANGEEQPGFPVTISGEAENLPGNVTFEPKHQLQRPALLLMNGVVYAGFGSHCDLSPYHGWIFGVSTSGQITTRWATSDGDGAAIWQAGGGLVSDGPGQILFATGNGFSPPPGPGPAPPEGHLGSSVARVQVEPTGALKAKDFFSPYNSEELDANDLDLGSGAPLALPSPYFGTAAIPHLLIQVGKAGVVYMLNREQLGGREPLVAGTNDVVSESSVANGVWASLATWPGDGGYVYVPATGEEAGIGNLEVLAYGLDGGGKPELTPVASKDGFEFGSGSPIVTSDGTASGSGIVWISRCSSFSAGCAGSTLDAYAAVPSGGVPRLLWSHDIGISTKFARPDASEGRIYVGTRGEEVRAFGALHHTLVVSRENSAGGSVRSDVPGIDCGSTCSHAFDNGATVTLTATPARHYRFTGWSEGGCSGTGTCQVTMYSDAQVQAHFAPISHTLNVSKTGAGSGSVVSSPPGISCEGTCQAVFGEGSNITLEAVTNTAAVTWSGCTSVSGKVCTVADLEADRQVTASFLPPPQTNLKATINRKARRATFHLRGTESTTGFQCKLVRPGRKPAKVRFAGCGRSRPYKHLAPGRYTFEARAVNAAGPDPTPVRRRFRI